jgi:branched-chain amino acid transport system substrate-binding protein
MKIKIVTVALISVLILAFVIFSGDQQLIGLITGYSEDDINIGVITTKVVGDPTTELSNDVKQGLDIAADEINSEGGINGKQVNLIYLEDYGVLENTDNIFGQIAQNNISVVFVVFSVSAFKVAPLAEKNNIILFSPSVFDPRYDEKSPSYLDRINYDVPNNLNYSDLGDYVFRNYVSLDDYTYALGKFLLENNYSEKNILLVYDNGTLEGILSKELFLSNIKSRLGIGAGLEIEDDSVEQRYDEIKNFDPEVIYLSVPRRYECDTIELVKYLNLSGKMIVPYAREEKWCYEDVLYVYRDSKPVNATYEAFISKHGPLPKVYSRTAYDALKIISSTLNNCSYQNSTCIKDELYNIQDYPGISGWTSFDENGDAIKPILIKTINGGIPTEVAEILPN